MHSEAFSSQAEGAVDIERHRHARGCEVGPAVVSSPVLGARLLLHMEGRQVVGEGTCCVQGSSARWE